MEQIRQWLTGIVATTMVLAAVTALAPEGKTRKAVRLAGSLLLILAILGPLANRSAGWEPSEWEDIAPVRDQIQQLRQEYRREVEESIAERTAAYISAKGEELGVTCRPKVTVRWEDEVPYPFSADLDIPCQTELARYLTEELGIPPERQNWQRG
jgi:hypothetical protein